jgi:hypothetical protein
LLKSGSWDGPHNIRGVVSPFSLRGDEGNIGSHKKERDIGELLEQEKSITVFNMTVLRGYRERY